MEASVKKESLDILNNLKHSRINPKYLTTNAASHVWVFGAIAELIDNAYDPDVNASSLHIEYGTYVRNDDTRDYCMYFTDNGAGASPSTLHAMLSFGFCEKEAKEIDGALVKPIGAYGNGFKSGSMRIGEDALVFTRHVPSNTMSIGLLSRNLLAKEGAEDVLIPMVTFDIRTGKHLNEEEDGRQSLQMMFKYSCFKTVEDLMDQFKKISPRGGTRIVISNICNLSKELEFDFGKSGDKDILLYREQEPSMCPVTGRQLVPFARLKKTTHLENRMKFEYSLREYVSRLFLKPRMTIFIGTQKVLLKPMDRILDNMRSYKYKPRDGGQAKDNVVKISIGRLSKTYKNSMVGTLLYHNNRLIVPYARYGQIQEKQENLVAVVTADSLLPEHNKQDFAATQEYTKTIAQIKLNIAKYIDDMDSENVIKKAKSKNMSIQDALDDKDDGAADDDDDEEEGPPKRWVQCDKPTCLKWRLLPPDAPDIPTEAPWKCSMNPDTNYNNCSIPQQEEDSNDEYQYSNNLALVNKLKKEKKEAEKQKLMEEKVAAIKKKKEEEEALHQLKNTRSERVQKRLLANLKDSPQQDAILRAVTASPSNNNNDGANETVQNNEMEDAEVNREENPSADKDAEAGALAANAGEGKEDEAMEGQESDNAVEVEAIEGANGAEADGKSEGEGQTEQASNADSNATEQENLDNRPDNTERDTDMVDGDGDGDGDGDSDGDGAKEIEQAAVGEKRPREEDNEEIEPKDKKTKVGDGEDGEQDSDIDLNDDDGGLSGGDAVGTQAFQTQNYSLSQDRISQSVSPTPVSQRRGPGRPKKTEAVGLSELVVPGQVSDLSAQCACTPTRKCHYCTSSIVAANLRYVINELAPDAYKKNGLQLTADVGIPALAKFNVKQFVDFAVKEKEERVAECETRNEEIHELQVGMDRLRASVKRMLELMGKSKIGPSPEDLDSTLDMITERLEQKHRLQTSQIE